MCIICLPKIYSVVRFKLMYYLYMCLSSIEVTTLVENTEALPTLKQSKYQFAP